MNKKSTMLFLIILAFLIMIVCACSGPSASSIQITTAAATTSAPASVPTVEPTLAPTPTPTPKMESVFIPREKLPDGQLFTEGYYIVLQSDGTYFNVFDCFGKLIYNFKCISSGDNNPDFERPLGLFTPETLAYYCRINENEVETVVPERMVCYENGFYQISNGKSRDKVYLYNENGKLIRTLTFSAGSGIFVQHTDNETIVTAYQDISHSPDFESPIPSITVYFVSDNGTINNKCSMSNIPTCETEYGLSVMRIGQILANKYLLLAGSDYFDTPNKTDIYDIYDLSGNVIMENVSPLYNYYSGFPSIYNYELNIGIVISDYFSKEGVIYDSSLSPVAKNETKPDGQLIPGIEYDVNGITCKTLLDNHPGNRLGLIAIGSEGNRTAIKTQTGEYIFNSDGSAFEGINKHVALLRNAVGDIEVFSLITGEVLNTIKESRNVEIADEYVLIHTFNSNGKYSDESRSFYIIDKNGIIRYVTNNATIKISSGEYILLERGPYTGVADLNGDWIMKSLTWEMTRDEKYDEGY